MHDCPECGQACYCDGDDTALPEPAAGCDHICDGEYELTDDSDLGAPPGERKEGGR